MIQVIGHGYFQWVNHLQIVENGLGYGMNKLIIILYYNPIPVVMEVYVGFILLINL